MNGRRRVVAPTHGLTGIVILVLMIKRIMEKEKMGFLRSTKQQNDKVITFVTLPNQFDRKPTKVFFFFFE